jgi:hypothetical protein
MMGVGGILGGALLSAIHGGTVINTLYQDGGAYSTFIQCLQLIVFGARYLGWLFQISGGFILSCCLYL